MLSALQQQVARLLAGLPEDTGFRPSVLAEMLDRFDRLDRDEFDVDDTTFATIVTAVRRWRSVLRATPS